MHPTLAEQKLTAALSARKRKQAELGYLYVSRTLPLAEYRRAKVSLRPDGYFSIKEHVIRRVSGDPAMVSRLRTRYGRHARFELQTTLSLLPREEAIGKIAEALSLQ